MAEKEGFEPSRPNEGPTPLAGGEPLQPLEYFSTKLAERVGFEPTWAVRPQRFSRPPRYDRFGTSPFYTFQYNLSYSYIKVGDPSATRTPDSLIKSQVLYRLS